VSLSIVKYVQAEAARMWTRVHALVSAVGQGVDGEFVRMRGGLARMDQNQLLFQRLMGDAVSKEKIHILPDKRLGQDYDAVDWHWYDRQLSASMCLEGLLRRGLEAASPENKDDPASVFTAGLRGVAHVVELRGLPDAEIDFVVPDVLVFGLVTADGLCAFLDTSTAKDGADPKAFVHLDETIIGSLATYDFSTAFASGKIFFSDPEIIIKLYQRVKTADGAEAKKGAPPEGAPEGVEDFGGPSSPEIITDRG